MRNAVIIAATTFGLLWMLSTVEFPQARSAGVTNRLEDPLHNSPWRRTANGWERRSDWLRDQDRRPTASHIHPLLIASFETLAAIGALLAFSPTGVGREHTAARKQN